MMASHGTIGGGRALLVLVSGFGVWAAAFLALYMMLTVGCALGWTSAPGIAGLDLQRTIQIALFLLAVAANTAVLINARKIRQRVSHDTASLQGFLNAVGFYGALAALGCTIATFLPVTTLTTCH